MNSKHTPTPWKYKNIHTLSHDTWYVLIDPSGRGPIMEVSGKDISGQIAEAKYLVTDPAEIEANAAFIVQACNNFDGMLEALEQGVIDGRLQTFEDRERWRKVAREAIAKAKEGVL